MLEAQKAFKMRRDIPAFKIPRQALNNARLNGTEY